MIALVLPFLLSCAVAAPHASVYSGLGILGPSYNAPILPVGAVKLANEPVGDLSHTVTNINSPTGAIKQQTIVGKDGLGGHTIRHSAQATNVDPHSGQTDVKHDEHEFHINPYIGQAAVSTNNAEGSLNPTLGKAAFSQKTHEAKIAPGHASVADVADTAAVSPHSSAASRDVNAARTDIVHDGISKNAHSSHKSYVNAPGVGGHSKAAETNHRSFDGPGYGNLHYDNQEADEAYDALGRAAANEAGYKLDQAYDTRVNLGASNEVQYSRHAAHDPYGNYGAVTQTRQSSQGGQLVPVVQEQPAVYLTQPAVVKEVVPAPVVYSEYREPESYVYSESVPVSYQKQGALVYNEPLPVSYQRQSEFVYHEPRPVSYQKQPALVYNEPSAVYKQPIVYDAQSYGPRKYNDGGYYSHGY